MKKIICRCIFVSVVIVIVFCLTNCSLYSVQNYGLTGSVGLITPYKSTVSEVIKGFGSPDAVYQSGGDDIYIFKSRKGRSFVGVYADIEMKDIIIIAREGIVREIHTAIKGDAMTILGGCMTPIHTVGKEF